MYTVGNPFVKPLPCQTQDSSQFLLRSAHHVKALVWTQKSSFVAIQRSCDAMLSRCMFSRHQRSVSQLSLPVFKISKEHERRRILSPTCNLSSTIHCQEKITTARTICLQIYPRKVACTRTFLLASSELANLEDRIAFGVFSKTDVSWRMLVRSE